MSHAHKMRSVLQRIHTRTWIALGLIVMIIPVVLLALHRPSTPEAGWYDDSYAYRKKITFTHNAAVSGERRITLAIDTAALTTDKMQADCDDSRFTDINGKVLRFQLTADCDTSSTDYDVVVNEVFNGQNVLYFYYGNPSATNASENVSGVTSLTPSGGSPSLGSEEKGEGPIAYWSFDEGAENTCTGGTNDACDASPNKNDAQFGPSGSTAEPTIVSESMCVSGKCIQFDGSNDYVDMSKTIQFDSGNFSIGMWFRTGANTTGIYDQLWNSGYNNGNPDVEITMSENKIAAHVRDSSLAATGALGSTNTLNDNKWHYVVLTRSSTTFSIYIDGTFNGSVTANLGDVDAAGVTPRLGTGLGNISTTRYFPGFLDEIKVYNYARSAAQIQQDYNRGSSSLLGSQNQKFLSDGLVGYWKMDETSGNAADSSGNGRTMTNNNTVAFTTGKFSNGADLESGSSEYFNFDFSTKPLDNGDEFTISAWIKPESNTASTTYDIVDLRSNLIADGVGLQQFGDEIRVLVGSATGGSATITTTSADLTTGSWYHVVARYREGNAAAVTILINGVEKAASTSGTMPIDLTYPGDKILIGAEDVFLSTPINFYDGMIDEVRVYKRPFADNEVRYLYNWAPGPVGHWKMDENTGTTAYDSSGNGNNLTPDSTSPTWDTGKVGSALNFDGDANQMEMSSDVATYDFADGADFTVMGWFKMTNQTSRDLLSKRGNFNSSSAGYSFNTSSSGTKLTFEVSDGTDEYSLVSGTSLSADTWYHFAVSWDDDSSTNTGMYINGVKESATATGTFANVGSLDSSSPLRLAAMSLTPSEFQGLIDDVKIYNYARTQSQILEDMNGGTGNVRGTRLSHVPYFQMSFDEKSGQTASNTGTSRGSLNGTFGGSTSVSTDDPTWESSGSCVSGTCVSFDGGDYINNTVYPGNVAWDNFTFTLWALPTATRTTGGSGGSSQRYAIFPTNGWPTYGNGAGTGVSVGTNGISVVEHSPSYIPAVIVYNTTITDWTHIAVVYSNRIPYLYVNGVHVATGGQSPYNVIASLIMGQGYGYGNYMGKLDEVKIYPRSLTASEILQDMQSVEPESVEVHTKVADRTGSTKPLAYWNFDEKQNDSCPGGTNDACDKSGNGFDGIVSGATWEEGKVRNGLSFDGTNDYVSILRNFSRPTTMTVGMWFRTSANNTVLFGQANNVPTASPGSFVPTILINSTGKLRAEFYPAGTVTSSGSFNDGNWHYLHYIANGTSHSLYVDTALQGTVSGSLSWSWWAYTTIGAGYYDTSRGNSSTTWDYFDGDIDEVVIYNYARSETERQMDYGGTEPIAHWRFDECQGTTAYDSSGNGLNGTITPGASGNTSAGTCGSGNSTEMWNDGTNGKYNASLGFDGTNDYVDTKDIDIIGDASASAWVKTTGTSGRILSKYYSGSNVQIELRLVNGKAQSYLYCSGIIDADSNSTINDGNWHHIVGVRDSGSKLYLYVDGVLQNDQPTDTCANNLTNNHRYAIGASPHNQDPNPVNYFSGQIDDVRLYNYALSPSQIKKLYNNASSIFFN